MPKLLMTVEDRFQIASRGLVVVPGPSTEDIVGPASLSVELRRPDGSMVHAPLLIEHQFQSPPSTERRWACVFAMLSKQDVPVGTEIWVEVA